jgi:hypothetical protein
MKPKLASKGSIVADLQRVFQLYGSSFTAAEYNKHGKYASDTVARKLGSWEAAIRAAGLAKKFNECQKVKKEIKNFDPVKESQRQFEVEKQKLIDREKEKEHKELKRRKMATEIVVENITMAILKMPPAIVEVNKYSDPPKTADLGRCTLWFDLSDVQLGTLVTKNTTGGMNEHNWKIWKTKLRKWLDGVKNIINRVQTEYKIDAVVIAQLGDIVEGHEIFAGQAYHMEFDVYQQMIYGAEDLSKAYLELAMTYPTLNFHLKEVAGNHGRIGKKNETPFHVNFDNILYEFIRLRLGQHKDVKNIKTEKNLSWFKLVQVYTWKHLLLHGDRGIGGKWGGTYSINSLEKADAKYQKMLQEVVNYLHMGHFHADASFSDSAGMKMINGNWIGGTAYASDITESNTPLQKAYLITPANGIEQTFYIHLKDRRDSKPEIEIDKITG